MLKKKDESGPGPVEPAPHYHGHRERLRTRFREAGAKALSDYELLELLPFRAVPRRDVKPLAKALIAKFGSFAETMAGAAGPARRDQGTSRSLHHGIRDRAGGGRPVVTRRGEKACGALFVVRCARLLPRRASLC